ncbi:TonB-dependent receptor [Mangrovibacterium diazotrophicum]|uniref:Iron complex outermembrane receptor protein n=1 Tax=Mangrovibacterium diazotrophicum TaxID=1261403 RepID=A0A419W4C9_9BACT|nr:TonB-dependent receptor [Mangrovibacterium diazotrophicum]RKD90308.1 iron complex outermembrane receptor protein [Mangrovibacterium diazotrophicum]
MKKSKIDLHWWRYPLCKKMMRVMKLTFMLVLSGFMALASNSYSQLTTVSMDLKQASVVEIFDVIEAQTNYQIAYNSKNLNTSERMDLKIENKNIADVLDLVLKNSAVHYEFMGRYIVISDDKDAQTGMLQMQQTISVKGKVTQSDGTAIPGATIIVKGTSIGGITDFEGNYSLTDIPTDAVLVFSFVGMRSQEVSIDGRQTIDVQLEEETIGLEEVVAIGYGTVKKRELTGSVSSVKAEDFNEVAASDPMQLIQGKVAGLSITRTNGGDPTEGFEIRLRGSSSISADQEPLVVVDGIPGGDLNSIAPEDIESMDILKDGSAAAIYGTRGTNGVILVTTKRGKQGNMQVEFTSKYTTQSILKRVEVLNADEYRQMKTKLETTHPEVAAGMVDYGYDTDWFDEIVRTPLSHVQHLSFSGGMNKTTYRMSLYYTQQEGVMLTSELDEYRANLNLRQLALNDKLQFTVQLGLSDRTDHPVNYDAFRQAIKRNPTEPVYNEDGSFFEIDGWQYENPVGQLLERTRDNTSSSLFANLGAELYLTESLKAGAVGGVQRYRSLDGYYEPSYAFTQETAGTTGLASRTASASETKTLETTIDFNKEFGEHIVSATAGYSFQEFVNEGFEAENANFISDDLLYNDLGSGTKLTDGNADMSSYKTKNRLVGFFARASYNYKGKYFLSASVRREGSSKFGDNNKWGTFPAVSGAWDLTQESFMGNSSLDQLKIRAGYGVTGNQGIDPYLSLSRMGQSGFFFYNGEFIPGYGPVSNPNPNLKWETKHEYNVGVDWSVNHGIWSGTVDFYVRDTKDLLNLYDVPVPPNLYEETMANVGSMRNSGIEVSLNAVAINKKDFKWNISLNGDWRKNKLLSLSNEYYQLEYRNVGEIGSPGVSAWTHRYYEGGSIGNIHGYVYEGLTADGEWIFQDTNGDGEITVEDRTDIGNGIPDFYAGLTNTLQYKNWDMSIMFRGMFGHQIINMKRIFYENPIMLPLNIMKSAMDSEIWDTQNFSSYYVENGDFVKLDNLTLGYTLPLKSKKWLKSGRIFFTGTNLLVITGYKGIDPEGAIGGLTPGSDDRGDYPSTRTYTLGINIKF